MSRADRFGNILIIKPGAIGDLLQLTPVIRALEARFQGVRISLLVGSEATAQLFAYNARVHETIVFEKKGRHRPLRALLELWHLLRSKEYDLVINFQRSNLKTWFLAGAAFPCRVIAYHKTRARTVHAVADYLAAVAQLGIGQADMRLEFNPGPENEAFAEKTVSPAADGEQLFIALNPGASHPVNRWSLDRFALLADRLARELRAAVMIIGGREDMPLAEEIEAKAGSKPLVMTGRADLLQLGALLRRCDLLVSGDTGPLHLATAVGTRVIALFGAADPGRTGPVGPGHRVIQAASPACIPCRSRRCSSKQYLQCMNNISVDTVFKAIVEMGKKDKQPRTGTMRLPMHNLPGP